MPILNYTTTVAVDKTVNEIQRILARHGARSILLIYGDDGEVAALSFLVATPFGERAFRLPANHQAVHRVLGRQYEERKIASRYTGRDQAARVSWRIIKDWIEAQLALIESEMVTLTEVMLPYLQIEGERTLYQVMQENQFLLSPGTDE